MESNRRLGHLLTATLFRISIYLLLVIWMIGLGFIAHAEGLLLKWAIGMLALAGMCAAIVAAHIPRHDDFESFSQAKLGFLEWGVGGTYDQWILGEYITFWCAALPVVMLYLILGAKVFY